MRRNGRMLTRAGLMAALCFIVTWLVQIPVPPGYVNFGDSVVLLSGWLLGPLWGAGAAAVGSVLVDMLGPYIIYAPATFVIRFSMALLAGILYRRTRGKPGALMRLLPGAVLAELLMVLGYLVYEAFFIGLGAAAFANIPFNVIQGMFGIAGAVGVAMLMGRSGTLK